MLNFYPKMYYSGGGGGGGGNAGGGGGAGGAGGGTGGGTGGAAVGTGVGGLKTDNICGEGGRNAISGSVFFDGGSYLTASHVTDFDLNADNFTIEYWFFETERNRAERRVLYLYDTQQAFVVGHTNDNGGQIFFGAHDNSQNLISGSLVLTSSNSLSDNDMNTWNHVAIVREGSNLKIYLNGVLEVTDTGYSTTAIRNTENTLYIGHDPASSGREFKGYLSNVRLCIGHAVYTSNFTPPSSPLSIHYTTETNKTSLLCCQDSDNALQEATGKTITGFGRYADSSVELVPNGGPTTNVTGWTANRGTVEYENGQIKQTRSGGTGFGSYATITNAVIGQRYRVSAQIRSVSSRCDLYVTTAIESGTLFSLSGTASATVDVSGEFTATATTLYVFTAVDGDGDIGYYNRVSVKAADYGDAPKVIPPFGTDNGVTFDGAISMNSSSYMCFPTGRTEERGRGRGVFFGGYHPTGPNAGIDGIHYLSVQSMGNAIRFGDLSTNSYSGATTCASSTRAVRGGGQIGPGASNPNKTNNIEFVTIATTGNSKDFGDMLDAFSFNAGGGNQTRGIWMGGEAPGAPGSSSVNTIQFVTIATAGNAQDFGDLITTLDGTAIGASPTRILAMGGGNQNTSPSTRLNTIDYVEIATTGNAQDFGDLTLGKKNGTGVSSNTRAIAMGGVAGPALNNTIDFVTIATTGNATDFGDLSSGTEHTGSVNNATRGVQVGGRFPAYVNSMEFITIATTGNSKDFGDIPMDSLGYIAGASDSHGGL